MSGLRTFGLLFLICILQFCSSVSVTGSRTEVVDSRGKYVVSWTVDHESKTIVFEAAVETTGFVGFGLSTHGGMAGADIVIGGVYPNGTTYFNDYHGTGNTFPVVDQQVDWFLESAHENVTHTTLRFRRSLDTCDPHGQDIPIGMDTLKIIWSYGNTDYIDYHLGNRGSYAIELLDSTGPEVNISKFNQWTITSNKTMPVKSTTYWCSIHQSPNFGAKSHIVGFRVNLDAVLAKEYLHHILVWVCTAPNGTDPETYFEPFVKTEGAECYNPKTYRENKLPLTSCRQMLYVWAVGGRAQFLPDHVGYPIGENKHEYVLLEVHYNNPKELANVFFQTQLEVYYTSTLRKHDAGVLLVHHTLTNTHIVPPRSGEFVIVGHCSSQCLKTEIPEEGINVFNVLLHSHLAGRKLKLRHFRGEQELPWIASDNNYAFDYQQSRPLHKEVKVLPGDHLTQECTYETLDRDNVTLAGLSTEEEMCDSFVWYYPKVKLQFCGSNYPVENFTNIFGIDNVTYNDVGKIIVTAPESLANQTFGEAIDTSFVWTTQRRKDLQQRLRYSEHTQVCYAVRQGDNATMLSPMKGKISYPKFAEPYQPITNCVSSSQEKL